MTFQTIRDFDLKGKTVLLRADLNVPAQSGKVLDSTRIDRLKPTIDYLTAAGARTLIMSHFGRPEGEQNPEMSLVFLLPILKECWGHDVVFSQNCIGPDVEALKNKLADGQIGLLENLRFHKGEEANDSFFTSELAKHGDIFINDAFSAAHRAHASTTGLAEILPSAAGLLMEAELTALGQALGNPEKPVAAIAGGSKISTKISVLKNLAAKVDYLILGGGMANTFIYARGGDIGSSLCEKDMVEMAKDIEAFAAKNNCEIIVPEDCVCAKEIAENAESQIFNSSNIAEGWSAIDAGPKSLDYIKSKLQDCKTVVWNGPMGVFEVKPFDTGTNDLACYVAELTQENKLKSIAGGGDTVSALENADCVNSFTYISTAGGAFLEWLEGKELPGVAALQNNKKAA